MSIHERTIAAVTGGLLACAEDVVDIPAGVFFKKNFNLIFFAPSMAGRDDIRRLRQRYSALESEKSYNGIQRGSRVKIKEDRRPISLHNRGGY